MADSLFCHFTSPLSCPQSHKVSPHFVNLHFIVSALIKLEPTGLRVQAQSARGLLAPQLTELIVDNFSKQCSEQQSAVTLVTRCPYMTLEFCLYFTNWSFKNIRATGNTRDWTQMQTPEAELKQLSDLLHRGAMLQKSPWGGDAGKGQNQRKHSKQDNKSVKNQEVIRKTGQAQEK